MTVNYNSISFGPIYAKDEREVRHIFEFVNNKIKEKEFKNQEIRVGKFSPTFAAVQAKWALPSDVVQYIEKSLTKKEMNKKMVGRKRPSYPKRSEIIKLPKQSEPTSSLPTPANTPANSPANAPANPPANAPTQAAGVREGVMARAMARAKARKLAQASASVSKPPTTPTPVFLTPPSVPELAPSMLTDAPVTPEAASLPPSAQETETPEIHPSLTTLPAPLIDLTFDSTPEFTLTVIESAPTPADFQKSEIKKNTFNCSKCYREFQKEKSLKQHVSLMHSENIFQCTFCPLEFKLESLLKKHQNKCTNDSEIMKIYPVMSSPPKISHTKLPRTRTLNGLLIRKEMKKDEIGKKTRQYPKTSEINQIDQGIDLPPKISDNEVPTDEVTKVTDVTEENNNDLSWDEIENGAKKQKMGPNMELKAKKNRKNFKSLENRRILQS